LPGRSLMKRSEGQQRFAGLATILKERGYHTRFYVTHDPHFDNMQGFLIANDFDEVIGQHDYPANEAISSLGVPDHVMFDRAFNELNGANEPFLAVILTGSHHGPFIIPEDIPYPRYDSSELEAKRYPAFSRNEWVKRCNAFSYADWSLGQFYNKVTETNWEKKTLLVITGDSGVILDKQKELDLAQFHVPLLLIDKNVIQPGISSSVGGQKDVAATIMDVLGGRYINNTLGTSLIAGNAVPHTLFIEGNMTGFILSTPNDYSSKTSIKAAGKVLSTPIYLLQSKHRKPMLYRLNYLSEPIINVEKAKEMITYSDALLTATYHLVKSRQVGLPVTAP